MQPQKIGRYEIKKRLGGGGFGDVYWGHDPTIPRDVAIKCLRQPEDAELLRLFRNEAAAAGRLVHENVVVLHDFGEVEGTPYLVMELLDGEDLGDILARGERPALHESLELMRQVAVGLQFAHENGIVHRDVKPSNIRRLANGKIKLLDFGIARVSRASTGWSTKTGAVVGTLRYMSPEQLSGERVDSRTDIFSYGVVYYELLTGKHPFDGPTQPALIYNIVNKQPPPINEIARNLPSALDPLIERLLAKDRQLRYQSLEEFLIDSDLIVQEVRQERASELVLEGERAFAQEDFAPAEAAIRQALRLDPRNRAARALRERIRTEERSRESAAKVRGMLDQAREFISTERFDEAISQLQRASEIDPKNSGIIAMISHAESRRNERLRISTLCTQAREALAEGRIDTARRLAARVADAAGPEASEPQNLIAEIDAAVLAAEQQRSFETRFYSAKKLIDEGSFDRAEKEIAALREDHSRRSESDDLAAQLERVRSRAAAQAEISASLAEAREHIRRGSYQDAIRVLEPLSERFPDATELSTLLEFSRDSLAERTRESEIESAIENAKASAAKSEFVAALTALRDAASKYPEDTRIASLMAEVSAAESNARIEAATSAVATEAESLRTAGQRAAALRLIDGAIAEHGDTARNRLAALRRQLLDEDATEHRRAAARRAIDQADALLESGDITRAEAVIELAGRNADEVESFRDVRARLESAKILHGLAGQIREQLETGQLAKALELMSELRERFGASSIVDELEAQSQQLGTKLQAEELARKLTSRIESLIESEDLDQANAALDRGAPELDPDIVSDLRARVDCADRLKRVWEQAKSAIQPNDYSAAEAILADAGALYGESEQFQAGLETLGNRLDEIRRQAEADSSPQDAPGDPEQANWLAPRVWAYLSAALAVLGIVVGTVLFFALSEPEIRTVINSAPPGASVRIGDFECTTPTCETELTAGDHEVELRLAGFRSVRRSIKLDSSEGDEHIANFNLEPIPHQLALQTNLQRGTVRVDDGDPTALVDGQFTLEDVAPGQHVLSVLDGRAQILRLDFVIEPGQLVDTKELAAADGVDAIVMATIGNQLSVRASKVPGSVRLAETTSPYTAAEPAVFSEVKPGSHDVRIAATDWNRESSVMLAEVPSLAVTLLTESNTGILTIETRGATGADVIVDGRRYRGRAGERTMRLTLAAGTHRVRPTKPGFEDTTQRTVRLAPAQEVRIAFTMEPVVESGSIQVADARPGTVVLLDGEEAGVANASGRLALEGLQPGEHSVELRLPGHQTRRDSVSVAAGANVDLSATLAPLGGTLVLTLSPLNATAQIRDPATGTNRQLAPGRHELQAGVYEYRASAEGYDTVTDTLEIADGENTRLTVRLNREIKDVGPTISDAQGDWQTTTREHTAAAYRRYLQKHPGGEHTAEAQRALGLLLWPNVDKQDVPALEAFRRQFSDATLTALADRELARLQSVAADERIRTDRAAIRATLLEYANAYAAKDMETIRRLWPTMPEESVRAVETAFKSRRTTVRVTYQLLTEPHIDGDEARVRCQRTTTTLTQFEGRSRPPVEVEVVFARSAGGWVIQSQ